MQRVLKKLYQCITNAKTEREEGARRGEYLQYGQVPKSHPR